MGITPQAPCTPNWMQNAPAESALKLSGRIQSGMNAPMRRTKMLEGGVSGGVIQGSRGDIHDGEATADVLRDHAGDNTAADGTLHTPSVDIKR